MLILKKYFLKILKNMLNFYLNLYIIITEREIFHWCVMNSHAILACEEFKYTQELPWLGEGNQPAIRDQRDYVPSWSLLNLRINTYEKGNIFV